MRKGWKERKEIKGVKYENKHKKKNLQGDGGRGEDIINKGRGRRLKEEEEIHIGESVEREER